MDLNEQHAEVGRKVEKITLESGEEGRAITLTQTFRPVTVPELWDACTNPDKIKQFFSPVTGELKVNGHFQVQNNASGTIETCNLFSDYRVTWELGASKSWVEVRISEVGEARCRLALSYITPINKRWEEYGAGAGGVGWEMSFAGLAYFLKGIKVGEEWFAQDETKVYLTKCSEAWGEAAIKGGEDSEAAEAAVRRTTASYVPS
ncbi:hypothetical protein DL771_002765 [Monosporascus sp. 5C6A]|nr:hypothetical protein DL771_002765 [Monosporascus sp. 5C6A]